MEAGRATDFNELATGNTQNVRTNMKWIIRRYDSDDERIIAELPGHFGEKEIAILLQRLVCMHLDENEVIAASLRRGAKGRSPLLDRIGHGAPMQYGENPYFTAQWKE